eukprot:CAMPEP_0114990836 /NCGR_PEP_ID=MMETSP0216-20121206/11029_1 /TAXON_ID=223996 /ORGANISM="Protocruzia adherens, Strain Boccale" /LENGTH=500 /DNA_ID=CAMNT_0002354079 /DNA_START=134 /DNA_END=1636 /DNA_ORIENTATION=-
MTLDNSTAYEFHPNTTHYMQSLDQFWTFKGALCYSNNYSDFDGLCQSHKARDRLYFTDTTDLVQKVDYMKEKNLMGMMFISDETEEETNQINTAVNKLDLSTDDPYMVITLNQQKSVEIVDLINSKKPAPSLLDATADPTPTIDEYYPYVEMDFTFYINCTVFADILYFYIAFSGLWALLCILWMVNTYKVYVNEANHLHKSLTLVPIIKFFEVTIYMLELVICQEHNIQTMQYLEMLKVSLDTIFQTIFFAIFLLIAKGLFLTRDSINRQEVIMVAMMTVIVYLNVSLNFIAGSSRSLQEVSAGFLVIVYLAFFVIIFSALRENLKLLRRMRGEIRVHNVMALMPAIKLKIKIFYAMMVANFLYFGSTIAWYLTNGFSTSFMARETVTYVYEPCVFLAVTILIVAIRPRHYPPYFTMPLIQSPGNGSNDREGTSFEVVPFYLAKIEEDSNASESPNSSFEDTPIVIINPTADLKTTELADVISIGYKQTDETTDTPSQS